MFKGAVSNITMEDSWWDLRKFTPSNPISKYLYGTAPSPIRRCFESQTSTIIHTDSDYRNCGENKCALIWLSRQSRQYNVPLNVKSIKNIPFLTLFKCLCCGCVPDSSTCRIPLVEQRLEGWVWTLLVLLTYLYQITQFSGTNKD